MRQSHRRCAAEAKRRARAGLGSFHFTVARGCVRHQRVEQFSRHSGYFCNGVIKRDFVRLRWFVKAAQLSHKLNCGGTNLFFGGWWFEIVQGFDVATHKAYSFPDQNPDDDTLP